MCKILFIWFLFSHENVWNIQLVKAICELGNVSAGALPPCQ